MVGQMRVALCVCVFVRPPTEKNIQLIVSQHINSLFLITEALGEVLLHFQVIANEKCVKEKCKQRLSLSLSLW